jgi:beta-carotene 3-hydroxylase
MHDGLVHQRWPFKYMSAQGLPEARLSGPPPASRGSEGRDGCVSFGFVYAEPVDKLVSQLQRQQAEG